MTDPNELEGIKQLLGQIVVQLERVTTQTTELMPLKVVNREYRKDEHNAAVSLVEGTKAIRQLANRVLGL
jgi:hypothetical protein